MNTTDNNTSNCAACGKGGDGLKTCNGCKLVKYCNATCQKVHRLQHKKECKKRAAELKDEALFKVPPPRDDCDICCLPLPLEAAESRYQACCGKVICVGCIHAVLMTDNRCLCPFCRAPESTSDKEYIERLTERVAGGGDAVAIYRICHKTGARQMNSGSGQESLDMRGRFTILLIHIIMERVW